MSETPQQYVARIHSYLERQDPLTVQQVTPARLEAVLRTTDEALLSERPQPDKWSIREIIAHLADLEIVYGYRIRKVIGESGSPIAPVDPDAWERHTDYARADVQIATASFAAQRRANLDLLKRLKPDAWERYGDHAERGRETLRDIVKLYAGHDLNHLRQIDAILGARSLRAR